MHVFMCTHVCALLLACVCTHMGAHPLRLKSQCRGTQNHRPGVPLLPSFPAPWAVGYITGDPALFMTTDYFLIL